MPTWQFNREPVLERAGLDGGDGPGGFRDARNDSFGIKISGLYGDELSLIETPPSRLGASALPRIACEKSVAVRIRAGTG
jgi:hypothetical protein